MAAENRRGSTSELSTQERFFRYFQHEITALQGQMERLENKAIAGGERKDATDHCLAGITRLSAEVKDASSSLPPYDLRTYTEAIKALQDKLAETQAAFAPKQKFKFKKNPSAISLSDAAEMAAQKRLNHLSYPLSHDSSAQGSSYATTPIGAMTPPGESNNGMARTSTSNQSQQRVNPTSRSVEGQYDITIESREMSTVILTTEGSTTEQTCHLNKLNKCYVDIRRSNKEHSSFRSVAINSTQQSIILCGEVDGPVHITGVKNSVLAISCRQFRMHECENVDIYLFCGSRPIIEDCHEVRFAEIPDFLSRSGTSQKPTDSPMSLLNRGTNMWNQIDDFKWLKSEQSPNWSTIPSDQILSQSRWNTIVQDSANAKDTTEDTQLVNEILESAGIKIV